MTAEELKNILLSTNLEEFVDTVVLSEESLHFSKEQISQIATALSSKFGVTVRPQQIIVVGSAKIGFGLFKKRTKSGEILLPMRPYRPDSDIDLAVVCEELFDIVWHELSVYANSQPLTPWDSNKLGDYLVYGWLRPDWFPMHVRLQRCDDWWDLFRSLSADSRFGRRNISAGLFHSREQLKQYQLRGLNQFKLSLEGNQ